MEVIKLNPRGYCHGVVTAINETIKIAKNPNTVKPIYVLGMIVHNQKIVDALSEIGVITLEANKSRLELLDSIDSGTVIFTAHGISPQVIKKAQSKKLDYFDLTCVDVYKTHNLVKEKLDNGYDIIYIGKKNHPEPEGVIGISKDKIHLVENYKDIDNLNIDNDLIAITNQTTMSIADIYFIMEYIKNKYPQALILEEVCNATRIRQEAVLNQDKDIDLCIVVGDKKSNNTKKLVEISEQKANIKAIRICCLDELDPSILKGIKKVSVTSGASTPTKITSEVINYLENYPKVEAKSKLNNDQIIRVK